MHVVRKSRFNRFHPWPCTPGKLTITTSKESICSGGVARNAMRSLFLGSSSTIWSIWLFSYSSWTRTHSRISSKIPESSPKAAIISCITDSSSASKSMFQERQARQPLSTPGAEKLQILFSSYVCLANLLLGQFKKVRSDGFDLGIQAEQHKDKVGEHEAHEQSAGAQSPNYKKERNKPANQQTNPMLLPSLEHHVGLLWHHIKTAGVHRNTLCSPSLMLLETGVAHTDTHT